MDDAMETLFVCAQNENQATCMACDIRSGTNLMNYKGGGVPQRHTLCLMKDEFVLTANRDKPLIHVWPMNAQEQISSVRFVLPGKVNSMAVSPDGFFLVAGIGETFYIWNLHTGRMLNSITRHYQPINCLRFVSDGFHFVTAGQDGNTNVWNLTQVASPGQDNQTPLYSFSDHGLPITDLHVGVGGSRAYMFTVSMDRTCRIYDLSNGTLLLTVVFSEGLRAITANKVETTVYVGSIEGNIFEFHIDAAPRTKEYHFDKEHTNKFVGHKRGAAVNCVLLSFDEITLISGGQDDHVGIWHIPSRQLLKMISLNGAITDLKLCLIGTHVFDPENKVPLMFKSNLRRMIEQEDPLDEEMDVLITEPSELYESANPFETPSTSPSLCTNQSSSPYQFNDDSSDEVKQLRAEVARLRCANKELFDSVTRQFFRKDKEKE